MADNDFNNGGADGLLSTDANFSLGHTPTGAETLVLDSVISNANLNFDENLPVAGAIDGIRFDNAYAGTVDATTFDVDLGTAGLDCTGGGAATLDLGTGTWQLTDGDLDLQDLGAIVFGTSEIVMAGTASILGNTNLASLTIAAGADITVTTGTVGINGSGILTVDGDLTIDVGTVIAVQIPQGANIVVNAGGELAINGLFRIQTIRTGRGIITQDGTISGSGELNVVNPDSDGIIVAAIYGVALVRVLNSQAGNRTFRLSSGVYDFQTFEWNVSGAGDFTWDLATNDPTVTVQDLVFDINSSGDGIISPGANGLIVQGDIVDELSSTGIVVANSCPITGTGTNSVNWDGCGATWGATVIDFSAGGVTFDDDWTCSSFTGTDGDLDLSGETLTASGAVDFQSGFTLADMDGAINCDTFTADGVDLIGAASWTLTAGSVGSTFHNLTITNCDASGGQAVDATDNCVDGGRNSANIDFGVVAFGSFRSTFSPALAGVF